MSNTAIQLKKSGVTGNTPSGLAFGEVALNYADGKLFYKNSLGGTSYISNQFSFDTINSNNSLIFAGSGSDTLSFVAGNNVTISTNTTTKTITINASVSGGSDPGPAFDRANSAFVTANSAASFANDAFLRANASYDSQNTTASFANGAFVVANSSATFANGAFDRANAAYNAANTATDPWVRTQANNAYDKANSAGSFANGAFDVANSAASFANGAFTQANSNYTSAVTKLNVTHSGASAYLIDQYSGNNPSIYISGGETIAFNLDISGHPFLIRQSSGGTNISDGLTHVSSSGVVTTGSNAQGKESGILFWKVPFSLVESTYVYQCQYHSGMVGNIIIQQPVSFVASNTTLAFSLANGAFDRANSAASFANGAFITANSGATFANGAFVTANSGASFANGAFDRANSAASFANGSFVTANSGAMFANGAFDRANAAYAFANTISGGSSVDNVARNSANSAEFFANGAFITANSAASFANGAFDRANAAFAKANTGTTALDVNSDIVAFTIAFS